MPYIFVNTIFVSDTIFIFTLFVNCYILVVQIIKRKDMYNERETKTYKKKTWTFP